MQFSSIFECHPSLIPASPSNFADIQQKFEDELEEAPYVAKLRALLTMSLNFPRGPSKILDHLYLGSQAEATNLQMLRELGITHIINCAEGYINTGPSFYGDGFEYLGFDAEDDWDYDIMQHFDPVYQFIEDARTSGGKVLIHCIMGVNRSGALTVSYLMVHKHMGPISATKLVKKARSLILSNESFQRQVVAFARKHKLLALDQGELSSTL